MWWVTFKGGTFHVVHSRTQPSGTFSGPFPSKAAAEATLPGKQQTPTGGKIPPSPPKTGVGHFGGKVPPGRMVSAASLVGDFEKYKGTPYVSGGSNPANGWDCSGAINWVLGHDFNMRLPGQAKPGWQGNGHGPVVVDYVSWKGASTVASPEAGDLCIWPGIGNNGHIGMAISPTHMLSALNPALGTAESPIHGSGPAGKVVMFRRITSMGGSAGTGCIPGMTALIALMRLMGKMW